MKSQKSFKRLVIKVGSSVLTDGNNKIIDSNLERVTSHIAQLISDGEEIILVSSGAIACGLSYMGIEKRPAKLSQLQAAAAIGQNILMQTYTNAFDKHNIKCAQILLTRDDFHYRNRYLNAKNTILTLLSLKVVPIINENDTVSVEEIKFGDNDMLSALVAVLVDADGLEILSDIEGLCEFYDKDKKCYSGLIKTVKEITPEIEKIASGTDSNLSVGGMQSKIKAVKIATNAGIPVVLADGCSDSLQINFSDPKNSNGTYFESAANSVVSKKQWIAFGAKVKGKIAIDDGAKKALLNKSASLLSPGITAVQGDFAEKEVIEIIDKESNVLARGITNYSCKHINEIKGKKSHKEVVHRNDLVLLV